MDIYPVASGCISRRRMGTFLPVFQNKKMTAPATVVSHRLALSPAGGRYSDNWNRLVTFRLSDNTELELYTTKEEYETLIDGQSGQLTWEDDLFLHFDPDPML